MIEGLSFLVLVFVAMPKKYIGGDPSWVSSVGLVHGVLFLIFCASLLSVWSSEDWSPRQLAMPFLASLLPFGPFVIDGRLKKLDGQSVSASDATVSPGTSNEE